MRKIKRKLEVNDLVKVIDTNEKAGYGGLGREERKQIVGKIFKVLMGENADGSVKISWTKHNTGWWLKRKSVTYVGDSIAEA